MAYFMIVLDRVKSLFKFIMIFLDLTPLTDLQRDMPFRASKKCTYKFDASSTWPVRNAVEEGDVVAAETLLHRLLRKN
jgi:hypothetical protein